MDASFEEKSIWIQLISTLIAIGGYFVVAWIMFAQGVDVLVPYVPLFISATVVLVIILVLGHIVAAITGRYDEPDERDRLIHWRAEAKTAWVLAAGIFAAITCMVLSASSVIVAHMLLLSLFLAQVCQFGLQLRYYRKGM